MVLCGDNNSGNMVEITVATNQEIGNHSPCVSNLPRDQVSRRWKFGRRFLVLYRGRYRERTDPIQTTPHVEIS